MKIFIVFDDTAKKNDVITDIIGNKGFADVVIKNKTLENDYRSKVGKLYPGAEWQRVDSLFEFAELSKQWNGMSGRNARNNTTNEDFRVLHCFSNFRIIDENKALLSLEKLKYIEEPFKGLLQQFRGGGGVLRAFQLSQCFQI